MKADGGNRPETWECHLRSWFLNGLRPENVQAVKTSYIEWKNERLSAVLAHALHAEELQTAKKERVKAKTDKDLQLALVQAVSKPGGFSVQRNQQKGGRRGKRQGGRNFEKQGCWICDTDDHEFFKCTKCRLCKKDGHWAKDCPENAPVTMVTSVP